MAGPGLAQRLEIAGSLLFTQTTWEARLTGARQAGTKRVAWSAVGNCCDFCNYMDGKVFDANDPVLDHIFPPHINCDCVLTIVGDREQGAMDLFDANDAEYQDLLESHAHFAQDPTKYQALRLPASPSGRDVTFRRGKDGAPGTLEWHVPRYRLPELGNVVETGVEATGEKWVALQRSDVLPTPGPRAVSGAPELLTPADRTAYAEHGVEAAQPGAIPQPDPGPRGHVGSEHPYLWNPADNDPAKPMPDGMRDFLASRGIEGERADRLRTMLWRWTNREYADPVVREDVDSFVREAPKFKGRIFRHIDLELTDGKVDLSTFVGGDLRPGGVVTFDQPTCFTAGTRKPGNLALVVERNTRGASIRGFATPASVVEDEIVVPRETEYMVESVNTIKWRRSPEAEPEPLVIVRLREKHGTS